MQVLGAVLGVVPFPLWRLEAALAPGPHPPPPLPAMPPPLPEGGETAEEQEVQQEGGEAQGSAEPEEQGQGVPHTVDDPGQAAEGATAAGESTPDEAGGKDEDEEAEDGGERDEEDAEVASPAKEEPEADAAELEAEGGKEQSAEASRAKRKKRGRKRRSKGKKLLYEAEEVLRVCWPSFPYHVNQLISNWQANLRRRRMRCGPGRSRSGSCG